MPDSGPAHIGDETDRVIRQRIVAPIGDRRLDKCLIGIGRCGFVLGPANHDAGIGLLDHMQQHVRILFLRPF
jgi:hypothetical protein